jgi:hypothetical protein
LFSTVLAGSLVCCFLFLKQGNQSRYRRRSEDLSYQIIFGV